VRRAAPLLVAVGVSLALVAAYVALGGGRYQPTAVADPCQQRTWQGTSGLQESLEQIVLSALDGAACELGVSREELVLALRNSDTLARFADRHGITTDQANAAVTKAVARSIDDAQQAGVLPGFIANIVRSVTKNLPPQDLLALLDRLRGVLG
jgi:hypothetical protein